MKEECKFYNSQLFIYAAINVYMLIYRLIMLRAGLGSVGFAQSDFWGQSDKSVLDQFMRECIAEY